MKRVLMSFLVACAFVCMVACSPQSSPKGVVTLYAESIMAGDYESATALFYIEDSESSDSQKRRLENMFNRFVKSDIERKGGVASFEVGDAVVSEDKTSATVKLLLNYSNGKSDEQNSKLKKVGGKWYLDSGK